MVKARKLEPWWEEIRKGLAALNGGKYRQRVETC